MARSRRLMLAVATVSAAIAAQVAAGAEDAAPIYGVIVPPGYRQWEPIAPAQEAAPLDELRVTLGNRTAVLAYGEGTLPFPDGAVLVKLAWKHIPSPEFESASIPGAATTVQVMVKDSKHYAATGGWGFGRFIDGRPVDAAQHETCFACHQARVKNHDFVFTRSLNDPTPAPPRWQGTARSSRPVQFAALSVTISDSVAM